jgi:hypothetical protein
MAQRIVVEIAGDDVGRGHQRRRQGTRDPILLAMPRVARADMPIGIEDAVFGEDAIGGHEVVEHGRVWRARHRGACDITHPPFLRLRNVTR